MPNHISALRLTRNIIWSLLILGSTSTAFALEPGFYASSSALETGNWAKVEVTQSGMQIISDATLKSLGFQDPEKVNVYGFGGRMLPETPGDVPADDLPLIPSIRVNGGIIFFGHGAISWARGTRNGMEFSHTLNPYSDHSYYFISDKEISRPVVETTPSLEVLSEYPVDVFTERIVHEQDVLAPTNTGRLMLGEDFRTTTSRSFQFNLPDNQGDVWVNTSFASKTSSGTSHLVFYANGEQLTATTADQMVASDAKLYITSNSVKQIDNPGNRLEYTIKFNGSGSVGLAALDFIELEYQRKIALNGGQIYFYINQALPSEVIVNGATASTVVWDVTDPIRPKAMETVLNGNTLTFVTPEGAKEFVAFEPNQITLSVIAAGNVANQNIHAMPAPGLLVISPEEYKSAAERLITLHQKTDGLSVTVLTPQEIYNEFSSGTPDLTAFRNLLKMWYDKAEGREGEYTAHCLIMSRPSYDNKMQSPFVKNAGYPRIPIWQSPNGDTESNSYSTDDYIGMLGDVPGMFNIGLEQIMVAVGRMPVKSLAEANSSIDKLEKYLLEPDYGSWRKNLIVIADDQDNGVHFDQAESTINAMRNSGDGSDYLIEKLYLDAYELVYTGTGATYPDASNRLLSRINEGVAFIDYIGHANTKSWGHESLLTWTDITNLKNQRLPFIFAATCEFMRWDADEISGAEEMWLNPKAGVIGMICPSRTVLISANGVLNVNTSKYLFQRDKDGNPLTVGQLMILGKNEGSTTTNKLKYGLIGDPSMRLPWPDLKVNVETINDIQLSSAEEYPVIQARSSARVTGRIENSDGMLVDDFNGIVEINLYDAEKVVSTNGNGTDEEKREFNDRSTRLYSGRVKVEGGKWSTTIKMPAEIENNFAPGLLSLYASDERGREANGASEKFYVYGYDQTAPEDFEGPKIIEYYLNSPGFVSGQGVSPSPVMTAVFSDPSGISVSQAGIGHNMTLELDGTTFMDDVSLYYLPDENDYTMGSVSYPLKDLEPGKHSLKFVVWDNANNSTTAILEFNVSALWKPSIENLYVDVNPAMSNVNFIVTTDGATDSTECMIEVFDLNGRKIWNATSNALSSGNTKISIGWNLCDNGGNRIPRGIYVYRATVSSADGGAVSKTKKLAVSAN